MGNTKSDLFATWCERFDRACWLIQAKLPRTPDECIDYLNDPGVRMNITVQQMVFRASTGEHWVQIPQ